MTKTESELSSALASLQEQMAHLETSVSTIKAHAARLESALQEEHIARQRLADRVLKLERDR